MREGKKYVYFYILQNIWPVKKLKPPISKHTTTETSNEQCAILFAWCEGRAFSPTFKDHHKVICGFWRLHLSGLIARLTCASTLLWNELVACIPQLMKDNSRYSFIWPSRIPLLKHCLWVFKSSLLSEERTTFFLFFFFFFKWKKQLFKTWSHSEILMACVFCFAYFP